MDPAVALVQAYLRVNGYFTVAEYPVLEATRSGGFQMATDLDLLAFRFPGAGRAIASAGDEVDLRDDWAVLRHAQFKDPTLGLLMTLEKAGGG